jgi:hypothetical protein
MRREKEGLAVLPRDAGFSSCPPDALEQTLLASILFNRLRRGIGFMTLIVPGQKTVAPTSR